MLLKDIQPNLLNVQPTTHHHLTKILRRVTGDPYLMCHLELKPDIFLCIRHVSKLILRTIERNITKERLASLIMGRKVLETIRCDNREVLIAATEKYGENIDVRKKLIKNGNKEESSGMIFSLFWRIGYSYQRDLRRAWAEQWWYLCWIWWWCSRRNRWRVEKSYGRSLPKQTIWLKNDEVEQVNQIEQGNIENKTWKRRTSWSYTHEHTSRQNRKTMKVKVRIYPTTQRDFWDKHILKLKSMRFIKYCPQASWQAVQHLVSKHSNSRFWTTTNLRPVNRATKAGVWPMPITEEELTNFKESQHFAFMAFCARYCQCLLDPSSHDFVELSLKKEQPYQPECYKA